MGFTVNVQWVVNFRKGRNYEVDIENGLFIICTQTVSVSMTVHNLLAMTSLIDLFLLDLSPADWQLVS